MNSLETRSVLKAELSRSAAASEPRVIKKYPNRRLYDTVESRYITLADIRRLVMDHIDFVVIDKKTQDDITRSILLQVIAEQEHAGAPLMSQHFLSQVIRSYGGAQHRFVGDYLEQSLRLLVSRQHAGDGASDGEDGAGAQALERWRSIQEELLNAMSAPGRAGESDPAAERRTDRSRV